jgi:hypothetical protein
MLPLHPVDIINGYGATAAEIDNQYSKANRGLTRRDGQNEHSKDLASQVAQKYAKRDQIDVHRKQYEFNRHQDDDDIFPVQENAKHTHHEQDAADNEIMFDTNHSSIPCPTG